MDKINRKILRTGRIDGYKLALVEESNGNIYVIVDDPNGLPIHPGEYPFRVSFKAEDMYNKYFGVRS